MTEAKNPRDQLTIEREIAQHRAAIGVLQAELMRTVPPVTALWDQIEAIEAGASK